MRRLAKGPRADQHVHPGQFARDRIGAAHRHLHQSPDRPFRLTLVATFSNSELMTSLVFRRFARLISNRTLSPSRTN